MVGSSLEHPGIRTLTEQIEDSTFRLPPPRQGPTVHSSAMRSPLASTACRLVIVLMAGSIGAASSSATSFREITGDTAQSRFIEAAQGLLESSHTAGRPLVGARASGHLARLRGETDASRLAALPTDRERLAWLEAAMSGRGLELGASPDQARSGTREALDLLAVAAPDDQAVRIDRIVTRIEAGDAVDQVDLDELDASDFGHRPFPTSPDAVCDRLVARRGVPAALAMLDRSDAAVLPEVVACVIAAGLDTDEAVSSRLDTLDHGTTGIGPTVILELVRRQAADGMLRYLKGHPESASMPGVQAAAVAAVAASDPEAALELVGGMETLDRLPAGGGFAIRAALARGLAPIDKDASWEQANRAGQLDDRIIAAIGGRTPDQNPTQMLDDIKSLRTIPPGRLVAELMQLRIDRESLIESIADLFRTGRYDLAYSLLIPNTTEPERPADQWLPTRIEVLASALARSDAAPDAFIPVLEAVTRLHGVDAQIEALAAISSALTTIQDEADLPDVLRGVLADVLVTIALRG